MSGTISILLGNGDGSFASAVNATTGGNPGIPLMADLSGNSIEDLVLLNSGTVSVLMGNGDGTFAAAVNYSGSSYISWVTIGDLTGNGKIDLVVAQPDDPSVGVFMGNGDGTFAGETTFSTGGAEAAGVVDYIGDYPDIAVFPAGRKMYR